MLAAHFQMVQKKGLCAMLAKQKLIIRPHNIQSNSRSVAYKKDKSRKL